jgi:hypothetical protein
MKAFEAVFTSLLLVGEIFALNREAKTGPLAGSTI